MFTYIYSLLNQKDLCECLKASIKFLCGILIYFCLTSGDFIVFWSVFPLFILIFVLKTSICFRWIS